MAIEVFAELTCPFTHLSLAFVGCLLVAAVVLVHGLVRPPRVAEATRLNPELHTNPVFMPSASGMLRIRLLRFSSFFLPMATCCWEK